MTRSFRSLQRFSGGSGTVPDMSKLAVSEGEMRRVLLKLMQNTTRENSARAEMRFSVNTHDCTAIRSRFDPERCMDQIRSCQEKKAGDEVELCFYFS